MFCEHYMYFSPITLTVNDFDGPSPSAFLGTQLYELSSSVSCTLGIVYLPPEVPASIVVPDGVVRWMV